VLQPELEVDRGEGAADGRSMIARLWDALRGRTEPAPAAPRAGGLDTVHAINQRIFETSLDLILVVDRRGTFTRVSPSALAIIGYPPGDMVGRSATEFVFQDDLENTRQEMRLARRGLEMRNFDCRYRHKDGRVVPLSWTGVWSEPEQQHFFIGRDMTERIAAEERQRHSQRLEAIGQLTGGIAHDFNNMLTVIIGNADQAQREAHNPATVQEACEMILEAGAHSADLIRRMLAFARQQPLQPKRTDVRRLVTEVSQLIRRTLEIGRAHV
jgi:PAS domain S-box-containing protein